MDRRRRLFLAIAACSSVTPSSFAQPVARVWRVGFLSPRRRPVSLERDYYGAFPQRMRELGYVEGRNLVIEWRFAEGDYDRLPAMAAELVGMNVDVILALGPPGALAARDATKTIPIVIVVSLDPVKAGLVASLAKPGGNITGVSNLATDLSAKHFEMLRTVVPRLASIGVLVNGRNRAHDSIVANVKQAAAARIAVVPADARTPGEIDSALSWIARRGAGALMIALDPLFIQEEARIAALALNNRLPSIFANREYAQAGGLMSYGQSQVEIYRRVAGYVDRIFRGSRPGELPIEEPTTLELFVNRRTANALGVAIPDALLVRAEFVD